MKKWIVVGIGVAAAVIGLQSQAEAAPVLTLHICQGGPADASCQNFGALASGVTVGDYRVTAIGASVETQAGSNSQTSTINVQRLTSTSGNALNIWLTATGYTLPVGPLLFDATLGASQSNNTDGPPVITYQAWFSSTNATGFPPAGSVTQGAFGCNPTPDVTGSCSTNVNAIPVPAGVPFSIVTLTSFGIPAASGSASYGSTGQANVTPVSTVPEPASVTLMGLGLFGLATTLRRRRQN